MSKPHELLAPPPLPEQIIASLLRFDLQTAIEFLPGGRLLATARLEVTPDTVWGHPNGATLLAVAEPPYRTWTELEDVDWTALENAGGDDDELAVGVTRASSTSGPAARPARCTAASTAERG